MNKECTYSNPISGRAHVQGLIVNIAKVLKEQN